MAESTISHRSPPSSEPDASIPTATATDPPKEDEDDPTSSSATKGSLTQSLIDSLFSPGLNNPTHRIMNQSFYGLFFTLFLLVIGTGGNIHVLFLSGVAVALWASVNWFLAELAKMPPSVRQPQEMPDPDQKEEVASSEEKKGQ